MAKTLLAQMKEDFQKAGQSTMEFGAEFRALTPADKEWFKAAYRAEGTEISN